MTDWELLEQYRRDKSNEAFRKLADRQMKMVYNTCRRDLCNTQLAEDATQLVFILLARKANTIMRASSIPAWLFSTARFVCKDMLKQEVRRRQREEVIEIDEIPQQENSEWHVLEPMLNDALTSLTASDREAVLMRYYQGMSLQEIAGQIGTTEDTARKRVNRAVERLRLYFQREKAATQIFSLDALLLSYAASDVPANTHSAVMSTLHSLGSAPGAAVANAHTALLIKKGAVIVMEATAKKIFVGVVAAVLLIGAGVGVPMLMAHIHSQQAASADTDVIVDMSPPVSPGQAADKAAIMASMKQSLDEFRDRDMTSYDKNFAPDLVCTMPGMPSIGLTQLHQKEAQLFQVVSSFNISYTVESVDIQGDTATVKFSAGIQGPTLNYHGIPAGMRFTESEDGQDTFKKINGQWLVSEADLNAMKDSINNRVIFQLPAPQGATPVPK